MSTPRSVVVQWVLTAIVVVGLAIQAWVHIYEAPAFAGNRTSVLSESALFYAEAIAAIVVGVALLVRPRWYTAVAAFVVAAAGTIAVVLYTLVDIGPIGPIPGMYDPYWAPPLKVISMIAEAVAAVAALWLAVLLYHRRRRSGSAGPVSMHRAMAADN